MTRSYYMLGFSLSHNCDPTLLSRDHWVRYSHRLSFVDINDINVEKNFLKLSYYLCHVVLIMLMFTEQLPVKSWWDVKLERWSCEAWQFSDSWRGGGGQDSQSLTNKYHSTNLLHSPLPPSLPSLLTPLTPQQIEIQAITSLHPPQPLFARVILYLL